MNINETQNDMQTQGQTHFGSEQKVALIVGASSGIGHHTALKLLADGYKVYNASRTENTDPRVINIVMDAGRGASVTAALNQFLAAESRIDLLIYSAGYSMAAPLEHTKFKDIAKLFDTNYFGAIRVLQKIVPAMRIQNGGRILLVSSVAANVPIAFDSFYSSSKAALDMLAKGLNIELEPFNIKVVSVQPGGTSTRFTYKRNVYPLNQVGVYADRMKKAVELVEKKEQNGMTPDAVADSIMNVINSKNPPEIFVCGLMNKANKLVQKVLPDRLSAYINKSQYNTDQPQS